MSHTRLFIASDHRGFALKKTLADWARENDVAVKDLGPPTDARCDAGDFAVRLAEALEKNSGHKGLLICGSGQAMAMTANRYGHLRAALCLNTTMARLAREHNDANVLVLGADIVGASVALDCLQAFLATDFLGGRYGERLQKLNDLGGLETEMKS